MNDRIHLERNQDGNSFWSEIIKCASYQVNKHSIPISQARLCVRTLLIPKVMLLISCNAIIKRLIRIVWNKKKQRRRRQYIYWNSSCPQRRFNNLTTYLSFYIRNTHKWLFWAVSQNHINQVISYDCKSKQCLDLFIIMNETIRQP
jgi:hypothetical protein